MSLKKPIFFSPDKPIADRWLCAPALLLIFVYRITLSPLLGNACRFYPSCSEYGRQAFLHRPFLTACRLTVWRLARCHPFHPGGYDPLDPDTEDHTPPSTAHRSFGEAQSLGDR